MTSYSTSEFNINGRCGQDTSGILLPAQKFGPPCSNMSRWHVQDIALFVVVGNTYQNVILFMHQVKNDALFFVWWQNTDSFEESVPYWGLCVLLNTSGFNRMQRGQVETICAKHPFRWPCLYQWYTRWKGDQKSPGQSTLVDISWYAMASPLDRQTPSRQK